MKALVTGWFSFEEMGATAGDLMARDVVCGWLLDAGVAHDVAHAPPSTEGVHWQTSDPDAYSHVVFVCGPFGNGPPLTGLLERFAGKPLIGVDLTLLEPLEAWDPFELLLERDSSRTARPDLAFLSDAPLVPAVGLVLIHPQPEYGSRDAHEPANAALRRLAAARDVAVVEIDTRLDVNATGLHSAAQIESLLARLDVVLTTRLHGTVLALKNGVPPIAVDPVIGGGKVSRQAQVVGWPLVFPHDVSAAELERAFGEALGEQARRRARACAEQARQTLGDLRTRFQRAF